jgi:hypothetical protein
MKFYILAVDVAAMAKSYQRNLIPGEIEFIDHAIITNTHAKLRTTLKTIVREGGEARSEIANGSINCMPPTRRQIKEHRVEFGVINLGGLIHERLGLTDADSACGDLCFATLDRSNEVRVQFRFIFQVTGEPILELRGLITWQRENFLFDGFKFGHATDFNRTLNPAHRKSLSS